MKITPHLFEAFLKCPTKCWLRSKGEPSAGNEYADWVRSQNESYRMEGIKRLTASIPPDECVTNPAEAENPTTPKWRLAVDLPAHGENLESTIHAVERVPSEGRGKAATFIPIRFIFTNKLTRDDKLLVAFDGLVLSELLGRGSGVGKIIHGDNHATLKVKTVALASEVRKRTEGMAALLANPTPPDLVLNRHCGECEFEKRCREKAIEKDDLSLLAGMGAKERKKLHSKGIFTVTQLSYTFRPRRRPKRLRDKKEKYHHAIKALAIREKKIHIVGTPELKIDGTPVYLDVEGLPDRDFYYLIGVRIGNGETAVQHSLWADTVEEEGKIWREFLSILETVERPVLIHYGSYETNFMKQMKDRHSNPREGSSVARPIHSAINLVSVMFAKTYFPTHSNGLKGVAGWLGFRWSDAEAGGKQAVVWRDSWERNRESFIKSKLVTYNAEDCEALALVTDAISQLILFRSAETTMDHKSDVVFTDDLKQPYLNRWREFSSPLSELEFVNKAAHWNYQRDRVYVRSSKPLKRLRKTAKPDPKMMWRVDKVVKGEVSRQCPRCMTRGIKRGAVRFKRIQEILFGRSSLKRRVIRYEYQPYWCSKCKTSYGVDENQLGPGNRFKCGRSVHAYIFYQVIELYIPVRTVLNGLGRLLGLHLTSAGITVWKRDLATYYRQTHQDILQRIVSGGLVHVDETHVNVKGSSAYVWVFSNMHEVVYLYSESREGEVAKTTLSGFKGVLVSDFYAIYDSFDCPQQKCLIHLVRDLNGTMLDNPYDEELKNLVKSFGKLLKTVVEDVDRHGLKSHFLRKHLIAVERFYRDVVRGEYQSPAAAACRDRFERNRDKLFSFLNFDGVPWNNNNAEHAIKAFARLRDIIEGSCTERGIQDYLILLSVCQTCKYQGLDFLDFLRSGERDIHAFAEARRTRKKPQALEKTLNS